MLTENFDEVYHKHFTEIYRHCYRIVRNKQDAEQLSNETFVKAYFHRNQFDTQKGNFRSWIFTIATHLAFDFIDSAAQKRRRQTNSLDDLIYSASDRPQPDEHSEQEQNNLADEQDLDVELTENENDRDTIDYCA